MPARAHVVSRTRSTAPPMLGALLRLGWQAVRRAMAADLPLGGFVDLQEAHLSVFQYPGPDGRRPSDLARQLGISRQATNHLIFQLESLGYVERRAAAGATRRRVYLTPRGRRLMSAIKASVRKFEVRLERRVGRSRYAAFLDVLGTAAGEPV